MGFNFSGAMRGLGAGLVNSGALMEEYNKRKFEEEQLRAKLDREEHMQRLQLQAQQSNADRTFKLAQTQAEGENVYRSKMLENDASRIELQKQEMQASAAERAAAASERSANAKVRSEQAARETEIYNMKIQEIKDKDTAISETSKALYPDDPIKQKVWSNMQKGYIKVDGKEKIGSEVVGKAIDTAAPLVEAIEDKDLKKEAASWGIDPKGKSPTAIRTQMTAIIANQIAETSANSNGSRGMLNLPSSASAAPTGQKMNSETQQIPFSKADLPSLVEQVINKDPAAIIKFEQIYKSNSKDPDVIEANRLITASKQNKPKGEVGSMDTFSRVLNDGVDWKAVERAKQTADSTVRRDKLDKYAQSNFGKNFNQLTDNEKIFISNMVK